jgi:glycosyltransferase involved in cell wall biosynthesis
MRILLTADPELPVPPKTYGGIERVVADLVQGLSTAGHAVGLVAHPDSTARPDAFFPWPGTRSRRAWDTIRNSRALLRATRTFRPDVLHSFSRLMYMAPVLWSRLPKIMSYQREPSLRTTRWANRLAKGSLRFTGCSEYICRLGRRAGGAWTAIHNCVDRQRFTFTPAVPADAPLVFLSRIESIKGPHLAIEAAKRAGRSLIIAGNHSATPAEAEYWRTLIEPHLGKKGVEYVGPVDDRQKNDLLGRAAALLVPVQWDEPFGIVFAEALACGTPVISCPRGALPEIVTDGETGYLVDSVEAMTVAIGRVAAIDRAECRRQCEERFSRDVITRAYSGLYQDCLSQSAGAHG